MTIKPMLAQEFSERGIEFPVYAQPKLDGIRCIASAEGLFTRNGKPIVSVPHVVAALAPVFAAHPGLVLDGELYAHGLKTEFQRIWSIVRKRSLSEADRQDALVMQFHAFDVASSDLSFTARPDMLASVLAGTGDEVVTVETVRADSMDALDECYRRWLADGYEGQMVRTDPAYVHGRTRALTKRKVFETHEFEIVAVHEGSGAWAGYAKSVTCRMDNGEEFDAAVHMPHGVSVAMLDDADAYAGRMATIRFQGYKDRGVPRFGHLIDVDRDDMDFGDADGLSGGGTLPRNQAKQGFPGPTRRRPGISDTSNDT